MSDTISDKNYDTFGLYLSKNPRSVRCGISSSLYSSPQRLSSQDSLLVSFALSRQSLLSSTEWASSSVLVPWQGVKWLRASGGQLEVLTPPWCILHKRQEASWAREPSRAREEHGVFENALRKNTEQHSLGCEPSTTLTRILICKTILEGTWAFFFFFWHFTFLSSYCKEMMQ